MRLTLHSGRVDSSGRHNDRNFDVSKAEHIDQTRMSLNKYYTYNGDCESTFQQLELDYYNKHFADALNARNEMYQTYRQPKRCQTMDQFFRSVKSRPEDVIFQVGTRSEHITGEELWKIAIDYRERFEEIYGSSCRILDMALHLDEDTPHVHVRRVWLGVDQNGNETVSQTQALQALGILPPDPDKALSKNNNAKMAFTHQEQALLMQICQEHGIELETIPKQSRKHLSVPEFKAMADELHDMEREISRLRIIIDQQQQIIQDNNQDPAVTAMYELEQLIANENIAALNNRLAEAKRAKDRWIKDTLLAIELVKAKTEALLTRTQELSQTQQKVQTLQSEIAKRDELITAHGIDVPNKKSQKSSSNTAKRSENQTV